MRKVILHYHLFKNAGTSLDAAFKDYLNVDEWATKEFPGQREKNKNLLKEWILSNPQVKCFSSHTALLPAPNIENTKVIPVIFLRHPIDRIVSAYLFEKKQDSESFGAVLAKKSSMAGYIETRLSMANDRQCRNFQSDRLAMMYSLEHGNYLARAMSAVESLPFIGVVEHFSDSLKQLSMYLQSEGFQNINLVAQAKNISQKVSYTLDEKLDRLRTEIGDNLYSNLIAANEDDLAIYSAAVKKAAFTK